MSASATTITRALYWLPRCFAIGYIIFLSLFSLDVFTGTSPLSVVLMGFLIHLIPSYILLIALIVAWKKETVGGVFFLFLAVAFTLFFQTYTEVGYFILISIPIFFIGFSFLSDFFISKMKKEDRGD